MKTYSTHGLRKHPLYSIWVGMKDRCHNPKGKNYKGYGTRNISVCPEWREDFLTFYNWAMSNGYDPKLQVDRINNNGNYEPSNCQFTTHSENQRNKSCSYRIFINGQKFSSLKDAALTHNVSIITIVRWCDGFIDKRRLLHTNKGYTPPKEGCRRELYY